MAPVAARRRRSDVNAGASERVVGHKRLFFKRFLQRGKGVASLVPSSASLARAVCGPLTDQRPMTVLELGAGTGAITREALRRLHPQSRLIAVEIDPEFARVLRESCPRAEVVEADAAELAGVLASMGVARVDAVLNGLPMPSLPRPLVGRVLSAVAAVTDERTPVSQITVMPLVYLPLYRKWFREVRFEWVVANFPPAGVYHLRGVRAEAVAELTVRG